MECLVVLFATSTVHGHTPHIDTRAALRGEDAPRSTGRNVYYKRMEWNSGLTRSLARSLTYKSICAFGSTTSATAECSQWSYYSVVRGDLPPCPGARWELYGEWFVADTRPILEGKNKIIQDVSKRVEKIIFSRGRYF
uniref:Putative secreted protein n=1 Tax=Anopheles triannulatus TaxID=58253 RepID=A0A2M4B252_9DIPT